MLGLCYNSPFVQGKVTLNETDPPQGHASGNGEGERVGGIL